MEMVRDRQEERGAYCSKEVPIPYMQLSDQSALVLIADAIRSYSACMGSWL